MQRCIFWIYLSVHSAIAIGLSRCQPKKNLVKSSSFPLQQKGWNFKEYQRSNLLTHCRSKQHGNLFFLTLIVIGHPYHLEKRILLVRNIIVLSTQCRQLIVPCLTWTAYLRDVITHGATSLVETWCCLIHVGFWMFLMKAAALDNDNKLYKVRVDLEEIIVIYLSYLPWSTCVFNCVYCGCLYAFNPSANDSLLLLNKPIESAS